MPRIPAARRDGAIALRRFLIARVVHRALLLVARIGQLAQTAATRTAPAGAATPTVLGADAVHVLHPAALRTRSAAAAIPSTSVSVSASVSETAATQPMGHNQDVTPTLVPETDPALLAATTLAYAAAQEEAGDAPVGSHVGVQPDFGAATHFFEADLPGYHGWRWAVTVAGAGPDYPITVSEVVLLPGPDALVAPEWVPWQERVRAGDLGVGDLLPTDPGDPRLVPGYLESDDEAVEELARDIGLGRMRVMSREGRLEAAARWKGGEYGPRSDMARAAPAHCGTCGFYLPMAGSLRAAFGVCGNEVAPADGRLVHVEYGCGAHSEAETDLGSPVPVADLVYDDALLETWDNSTD